MKVIILIILGLLILFCGSVYPIFFGANIFFMSLVFTALVSLFLQEKYSKSHLTSVLTAIGVLTFFLVINWCITGFNIESEEYLNLLSIIIIVNISLFAIMNNGNLSINDFDILFIILLVHSILNFFLSNMLTGLFHSVSNEFYSCKSLSYIFFYKAEESAFGLDFIRNQGIFWEPGVLAVVLNLFLFRLMYGNHIVARKGLIFVVSFLILTTFSTTGLLVMFLQISLSLLRNKKNRIKNAVLLFIFFLTSLPILFSNLTEKISGKSEASYIYRSYDAAVALEIIKDNIFSGIGFSRIKNEEAQKKTKLYFQSKFTEARGNTNSVISVFLSLGVPLGILFFYLLYKQNIINYNKGFFFIILLICLASEPLIFSPFFILFVSSAFYETYNSSDKSLENTPVFN